MSFDTNVFTELVDNPMYDLLKKPAKIDKSNQAYELPLIPTATAKGSYGETTSHATLAPTPCYNGDGSLHYIDVSLDANHKANLQGSYLLLTYTCVQARLTNAVDGTAQYGAER